ncbi:MAG TPA: ACP S-malonyltransferase [Blastocatellia bacterium]|nr:ACP S-malonyltransferase [Blastocatellia bacterium]
MSTDKKTAFVFPGQGSQAAGMGKALAEQIPAARRVFEEADSVLGMRLSSLCFEGPDEELKLTANTQPAILATSIAALRAFEERGPKADFVAGHSLGEYTALVAAGSLKLEDALRVVRKRGLFMQEAVPQGEGAMAALIGGDLDKVNALCHEASALGVCAPANINSPGQTVIAGHKSAVEHAVSIAKEKGIRRAVLLAVSAPFHCELMKPAADRLAPVLDEIEFLDLNVPLVTNVDARMTTSGAEARAALIRQVASPVRWSDSVRLLVDQGVTRFVEIGPGKVLSGLIRQIDRDCDILNVDSPETLEEAIAACGS